MWLMLSVACLVNYSVIAATVEGETLPPIAPKSSSKRNLCFNASAVTTATDTLCSMAGAHIASRRLETKVKQSENTRSSAAAAPQSAGQHRRLKRRVINWDIIKSLFGMSLYDAAKALDISHVTLKTVYRRLGLKRWPYMRRKAAEKAALYTMNAAEICGTENCAHITVDLAAGSSSELVSQRLMCSVFQEVVDKRKTVSEKHARTALDNTAHDIQEARDGGGDDAEEDGESEDEDEHGQGEGTEKPKRRQARSFYFTTGAVKRIQSKEGTSLTGMCQVGGHADCNKSIPMPNGGTQSVQQHFLKCHTALNAKIKALRALKLTAATVKEPPNFLMLLNQGVAEAVDHPAGPASQLVSNRLLSRRQPGTEALLVQQYLLSVQKYKY
jgi:hypothetical protein